MLVFADQMRSQAMGCAGNAQVHTPNLDGLAGEGVMLRRAYSNAPVCTPARGSLLTGCWPLTHRAFLNDVPIRTDLLSLGTVFRDAGHATGYVGKWHLDGCPRDKFTPPGPRRLGFDDFWAVHNCTHAYMDSFYYADTDERIPIEGYEPEAQTELALSFIDKHKDRPFCLTVSWGTPHNPYELVPDRFKRMYPPEKIHLRPNVPEEEADLAREELAGYYAHVTALDEYLGRILARLDEHGLADDTLVVFTSDHGDMLHSNSCRYKQQPFEESISIPLIVRKPGLIPAGVVRDGLIGIVDLLPTMLGLAGVPVPSVTEGVDLSAMVTAGAAGLDEVLIGDCCAIDEASRVGVTEWRGLRDRRYTYARDLRGPWVLYDNEADPFQMKNLIDDPQHAELQQRLDDRVREQFDQIDAPLLGWEEMIRRENMIDLWNIRERELHKNKGRFLEP